MTMGLVFIAHVLYVLVIARHERQLSLFPRFLPVNSASQRSCGSVMNEGLMIHPMHLHGMYMNVFAADGALLPQPFQCDTLNIAPGQRFDVIIDCQEPGAWAFHCHILNHAESAMGMFGMVTALVIK